jgi:hypothetical protein
MDSSMGSRSNSNRAIDMMDGSGSSHASRTIMDGSANGSTMSDSGYAHGLHEPVEEGGADSPFGLDGDFFEGVF